MRMQRRIAGPHEILSVYGPTMHARTHARRTQNVLALILAHSAEQIKNPNIRFLQVTINLRAPGIKRGKYILTPRSDDGGFVAHVQSIKKATE